MSEAVSVKRMTRPEIDLADHAVKLALVSVLCWIIQFIAVEITVVDAIIGIVGLYLICVAGVALAKYMPFYLPSVAWISLDGILLTLPFVPGSGFVVSMTEQIDFLALTVPCLAYAGLAISKNEIDVVKSSGWKLLIVAIFVLFGTYFGSVVIADLVLRMTGA